MNKVVAFFYPSLPFPATHRLLFIPPLMPSNLSLFFRFAYPQSENESSWGLRLHCSLTIQKAIIWILNRNRRSRNIEFAWNRKPWSAPIFAPQTRVSPLPPPPLPPPSANSQTTTHLYFCCIFYFFLIPFNFFFISRCLNFIFCLIFCSFNFESPALP